MRRNTSVTGPVGAGIAYRPSAFVTAPNAVPTADTLTPATGSFVAAEVTRPVIWRCCAETAVTPTSVASARFSREMRVTTSASSQGATEVTDAAPSTPYAAARTATSQDGSGRSRIATEPAAGRIKNRRARGRSAARRRHSGTGDQLLARLNLEAVDRVRGEH